MLSLLKNNPLSPIFRCEELKKVVVEIKTGKNIYKIAYKKLLAPKQDLDQDWNDKKKVFDLESSRGR